MSTTATVPGTASVPTLSITLRGTFLYVFPADIKTGQTNYVDIYAAFCPYHEAGFFYCDNSYSETDLWQSVKAPGLSRDYKIDGSGLKTYTTAPTILSPGGFLPAAAEQGPLLKPAATDKPSMQLKLAMFHLQLPLPMAIYPLYCDEVEVVRDGKPTSQLSHFATAVRFLYEWDTTSPIELTIPGNAAKPLTPPIGNGLPNSADIEVRYEGLAVRDANDEHSDARSCFANLLEMTALPWSLNYNDGFPGTSSAAKTGAIQPRARTGGDCYAPSLFVGLDG